MEEFKKKQLPKNKKQPYNRMKRLFLIITFLMIVINLSSQEIVTDHSCKPKYNLVNTHWVSKIGNCCSNYYDFKEHGRSIFYSGERNEYSPGVYSIKKDTLFLHEFHSDEDDAYEILDEDVKFVALINGNSFKLLYREDIVRTQTGDLKWIRTKLTNSAYKKTNRPERPISKSHQIKANHISGKALFSKFMKKDSNSFSSIII